jgi:hypothetical protein
MGLGRCGELARGRQSVLADRAVRARRVDGRNEGSKKLARLVGEQRFDFSSELFVLTTDFGQKTSALVYVPFQNGIVDLLDPLPAAGLHGSHDTVPLAPGVA